MTHKKYPIKSAIDAQRTSKDVSLGHSVDEIRHAVRGQSIDRYVLESILDSYLVELSKTDPVSCVDMMQNIETDAVYASHSLQVIFEALMLSTLAGTVDDFAYAAALQEVSVVEYPELRLLRQTIFKSSFVSTCASTGGSPERGKNKERSDAFEKTSLQVTANHLE